MHNIQTAKKSHATLATQIQSQLLTLLQFWHRTPTLSCLVTPEMPGTTATMPWAAPLSQLLGTACMALNSGVTHAGHSIGLSLRFVLLGTKADFTPFT